VSCNQTCVERAADMENSVPEGLSLPLSKRYTGQTGFLDFIQDFRSGQHAFKSTDFTDPENTLRTYKINTITVFYRVDIPPTLKELLSRLNTPQVIPTIIR